MSKQTPSILDEIRSYLERFIVFSDADHSLITALWILHTRTFMESFPRAPWVTPYLYIYSETPGAGKSTFLRILRTLVYNPEIAGDITSAAMFTLIGGDEEGKPTLLIDEVDTVFNGSGAGNEALRRTLNTGYEASGYAVRKQGREAIKYSTFCPKVLAGINSLSSDLPETVKTRSIPVKLVKGHPSEIYYSFMAGPEAEALSEKLDSWIRSNGEEIISYMPKPIESMEPRAFEISFPLLQIAHALGVETEARAALIRFLAPEPPKDNPEVAMLRRIREAFDSTGHDKLFTAEIVEALGEGWNGKLLGSRLRQIGVGESTNLTMRGRKSRGYKRSDFSEVWSRYL